jgi:hypothetical protein
VAARAVVKVDCGQLTAHDFISRRILAFLERGDSGLERVVPACLAPHALRNRAIRWRINRPYVDSAREISELLSELGIDHKGNCVRSLSHWLADVLA